MGMTNLLLQTVYEGKGVRDSLKVEELRIVGKIH
jgi:hypothetical protein